MPDTGCGGCVAGPVYTMSWLFLLGSFVGVLLESGWEIAVERRRQFEPRVGVLYLPLNPLYGAATVAGAVGLHALASTPVLVFFVGAIGFSVIEYVASFVLEWAFGSVFWDYSNKPFNVHGRVCLEYALYWGVLALVLVYFADPVLRRAIELIPRPFGDWLVVALLLATVGAAIATTLGFARLRERIAAHLAGRSAEPLSRWQRLADQIAPPAAVLEAFPRMNLSARYRRLMRTPRAPRPPRTVHGVEIDEPSTRIAS